MVATSQMGFTVRSAVRRALGLVFLCHGLLTDLVVIVLNFAGLGRLFIADIVFGRHQLSPGLCELFILGTHKPDSCGTTPYLQHCIPTLSAQRARTVTVHFFLRYGSNQTRSPNISVKVVRHKLRISKKAKSRHIQIFKAVTTFSLHPVF